MEDDTKQLEYSIAFVDGALAAGNTVRIEDPILARDIRGFLEELRQRRDSDFAKAA